MVVVPFAIWVWVLSRGKGIGQSKEVCECGNKNKLIYRE
jgi:hypothetical protein